MKSVLNFTQRWGLIFIGILLIMCGLIYTAIPQTTPYQKISKAFIAHYLSGRGIGYMQLEKSPTLYIVNEGEFLPAFSSDYLNHGNVLISFLYRSDETTSIDASSDNNVHLVGPAFPVVRITLYHQYGQQPIVFSTQQYFRTSNGYYQHNWIVGIAFSILGLILIVIGFFMTMVRGKKKKQLDSDSNPATTLEAVNQQPEKIIQP